MNQETKNFEQERKILDSGNRRQFESGAVRDIAEGKGRCDLLPLDVVADLYSLWARKTNNKKYENTAIILENIDRFIRNGDVYPIFVSLSFFRTTFFLANTKHLNLSGMLIEVSKHYEEGGKKYAERNWEKGIPTHCYVDSAVRHLIKWADNWDDEPHDRAFVWNLLGLIWTIKHKPELDDLPYTLERTTLSNEEAAYVENDIRTLDDFYNDFMNTETKNYEEMHRAGFNDVKEDKNDGRT